MQEIFSDQDLETLDRQQAYQLMSKAWSGMTPEKRASVFVHSENLGNLTWNELQRDPNFQAILEQSLLKVFTDHKPPYIFRQEQE